MATRLDLRLLSELINGKVLTTPIASKMGYGHHLPGRIHRLRKAGYNIRSWPADNGYFNYSFSKIYNKEPDLFEQIQFVFDF